MRHAAHKGFSLIELLVAMSIGAFLIIGAVTMQSNTRKTFAVNEAQARLQETARYVISVLEPEIQLAGLYGFSNKPETVNYYNAGTLIAASNLRQSRPALTGVPAAVSLCGTNFAVDVYQSIQAYDNSYGLTGTCTAGGGGRYGTADTLVIRRTSNTNSDPDQGYLQVYTNRKNLSSGQQIFNANSAPGPYNAADLNTNQVRNLVVEAFYVAINADNRPGLPALRMRQLDGTPGGAPTFTNDQEVIRGVEDIQVELGVDMGRDKDGDGIVEDEGGNGMATYVNGDAERYVTPGSAAAAWGQITAVRLWVRVRAEDPETGYVNNRNFQYANVNFTPAATDHYRRVLMSRTIFLRNARAWATSDPAP